MNIPTIRFGASFSVVACEQCLVMISPNTEENLAFESDIFCLNVLVKIH